MNSTKWFKIGQIGKASGLKGACYISCHPDLQFEKNQKVRIGQSLEDADFFTIESIRFQKNRYILKFKEITDKDSIVQHLGLDVWLQASAHINSWLLYLDCDVFDKNHEFIGKICNFFNHGAGVNVEICSDKLGQLELPFNDHYFLIEYSQKMPDRIFLKVDAQIFADLWEK